VIRGKGVIRFLSDAPLEKITGTSKELTGTLDVTRNTFLFRVQTSTFEGFSSPLQKIHYQESYLECESIPDASFEGVIVEQINLGRDGSYEIRAKGRLNIHGIPVERIIKATVKMSGGRCMIHSEFTVPLADHAIRIPRLVHKKIAEIIQVSVTAECIRK
jgi:hypothetical protein